MTTKKTHIDATTTETFVARGKITVNRKNAIVRGWQSVTPEVIEMAQASDNARIEALTQKWMAELS